MSRESFVTRGLSELAVGGLLPLKISGWVPCLDMNPQSIGLTNNGVHRETYTDVLALGT